ncbi:MAG: tetratricopeptide repeat protein [Planctomycetes bacterium B3_Pla]|nr:MAG: tetratricopeptide repeat protein [Planctomycetes bacterium B3_Pla]
MSEKKKPILTRNFMKNLSRGAVKSVPLGGALLEQMIYGTLDGEAAKEEAEKLHSALSQIVEKLQGQDVRFGDIISELGKQAAFREEIKAEIDKLHAVLKDPENAAISDELADAVERMIVHNLPYRSMGGLFKGREDMLERLRSELGAGKTAAITQVQAIHGLGGVGKTRLAVEYAWSALEDGQHTAAFFVVADTVASLHANLAALAGPRLLNLPEQESPEQPVIVETVLAELTRRTGWLMLIDNVDSDEAAARLHKHVLPRLAGGNVLITSRRSNWPDDVADLAIDKLDEPDAVAYLLEKTQRKRAASADDEKLAKEIARKLDGLPVALEQAASYVCQRRIGFGAYLQDFGKSRKKVLSWHRDELNYPVEVLAAWQTTNEHLGPFEQGILRLASFLAPEAIPATLFESQPEKMKEAAGLILEETAPASKLRGQGGNPDVRGLLAELAGWSMITLEQECFTMHRLVQDSTRLSIPEDRRKPWAKLALELVNQYIPADPPPDDVRSWATWKLVDSHVAAIVAHADGLDIREPTTRLMNNLAVYVVTRARFDDAEPMYRRALEIDEQALGKDHPKVATRLNNLAELLRVTNRLTEAEPMYRRALVIDERSLGKDHPNVAIRLNNLAQLLQATNRLDKAEPMMRRALVIDEQAFGKNRPRVAIDLNNLATLLLNTNRLAEAEPLMRRVVEILENPGGDPLPNYAGALNNLAQLLQDTNRFDEAEPLMRRALEIDEQSFGKDHPDVAIELNNLAQLLQATNQLNEAEPLIRRALEIDEQFFGKDHPNVAIDLNNLATLLTATNRLAKAKPMYRRALEIDEQSFGKDHPDVASDLNNLAQLLQATNRLDEAEPLMRRALEIDEQALGKDHPDVASDLNNLALLLRETNRLAEAEPLMRRALEIFEKSLGPDHPRTQTARRNLEGLK